MILLFIGTNGTGKSSFVKSLQTNNSYYITEDNTTIGTVFPEYNIIAVGKYWNERDVGGADNYNSLDEIFYSLDYLLQNYPNYDIILEGIFPSTIKTRMINKMKEIKIKYHKITIVIQLKAPYNLLISRILSRKKIRPTKMPTSKHIISKIKTIDRIYNHYKKNGFITLKIDSSKLQLQQYKPILLKIQDKYKPMEAKQSQ